MTARRRLSVLAVIVLAVIPAAVVLIASLAGDRERMVSYFEVATVDADGHATVDEVIDYDFGAGSERHGIYRIVPGLTDSSPIAVSSPDAPDQVQITGGNIRIGDPNVTVSGSHRYQISYGLDTLTAGDRLAWNIVGTEWDVTIESVEAHVISARELSDLSCDQGPFGTEGGCDAVETEPGHLVVRTGPIPSGQAVTVRATLGAPVAAVATAPAVPAKPADTGAPLARPFLFGFLAAAVAGLVTGRILRRAGREYAPAGYQGIAPGTAPVPPGVESPFAPLPADATRVDAADLVADAPPQVAPPRTLTAAQGGVVLAEKVQASHQAAWLLGQAQHGAIALEGDPKKPTMRWLGGHGAADNAALLTMFHSRPTVELGTYDPDFASGWKMVGAELDAWRTTSGLWSDQAERRRKWVIGLGVLVVIVGLVAAALAAFRWSLSQPEVWQLALLSVPTGVGLGMVLRAWELRVRTPAGSALFVQVEAFRRHLADAQGPDVDRAADAGLIDDYLAWAVALGESKAWTKAVEASSVPRGTGYDPSFLYIAASLHSSTTAAATTPSSSGGGGGGAGGGGGGGGGGSW